MPTHIKANTGKVALDRNGGDRIFKKSKRAARLKLEKSSGGRKKAIGGEASRRPKKDEGNGPKTQKKRKMTLPFLTGEVERREPKKSVVEGVQKE